MFERFTEQARKVLVLAQEETRHFNHNHIGTEHLLLGLLREDEDVAARALNSLNVTLDEVREQVEGIVGYGEEGTGGQAPFSPRAKEVLESALREALDLRHGYIGTEHLLLGLVQEPKGIAVRALSNLGMDPEKVRHEVIRMLGSGERSQRGQGGVTGNREVEAKQLKARQFDQERFTEQARKVLVLAQKEAQHFNHNHIGTEHLLLGLLREDEGVAARALSLLNVTLDEVREQVESIVGHGEKETNGQERLYSRAKKVLELALGEASQLGYDNIGTEHILLGLVQESKGVAVWILSNLGIVPDEVRQEVMRMLDGDRSDRGQGGVAGDRGVETRRPKTRERDPISNAAPGSPNRTVRTRRTWLAPMLSAVVIIRSAGLAMMLSGVILIVTILLTGLAEGGFFSEGGFFLSSERMLPFGLPLLVALPGLQSRLLGITPGRLGLLEARLVEMPGELLGLVRFALARTGLVRFVLATFGVGIIALIPIYGWIVFDVLALQTAPTPGTSRYLFMTVINLGGVGALWVGFALFGIAAVRVGLLSRWAAGMLALGLPLTLGAAILIAIFFKVEVHAWGGTYAGLIFRVVGWELYPGLFWLVWGSLSVGLGFFATGLIRLGYALWSERGISDQPLEQAIHHLKQALEVRTRQASPVDWATTQSQLGIVYSKRIRGDRAQNLEQAIYHYQQALEVYTRKDFPMQWAMTQNHLATAYSDRIRGDRAQNLEWAIHH